MSTPKPLHSASPSSTPAPQPLSWWKYGHMWMVVGGPALVVVASFVTLYLAIRTPDPVYSDADRGLGQKAAMQPADEHDGAALAPAMQARNHAATGGLNKPQPGASGAATARP